jgi:pimeloyl-ACP methyl ester carboxylesterase
MSKPLTDASTIPVNESGPVITYSPVVLEVPDRLVDLEMKVSAPATGDDLPIILLSHGHGVANFLSSLRGYGPLADFWAAHGFVVIQPTHLDSTALGLRESGDPEAPMFLRSRATDMSHILDHLDDIEATVPGLAGRLDRDRIAVAGHSLGGSTASMLLGAQALDPNDHNDKDLSDSRIKAGVVISAAGVGNDGHLSAWAAENYPVLKYFDFSTMTTPALVVAGDQDINFNFSNRLGYRADAYSHSPAPKSLLMIFGAQHMLGGISGYDALETSTEDHEDPERVAAVRALCWAYLWSQLYPDDKAWSDALGALQSSPSPVGSVESK